VILYLEPVVASGDHRLLVALAAIGPDTVDVVAAPEP
jgi:hypothetical protein